MSFDIQKLKLLNEIAGARMQPGLHADSLWSVIFDYFARHKDRPAGDHSGAVQGSWVGEKSYEALCRIADAAIEGLNEPVTKRGRP